MRNLTILALVLLFSLSGCTLLLVPAPPDCVLITGIVVDSLGGNLVAGASVYMDDKMVLSDENGKFSLKVSPFEHDILVFKEGHAGSRVQDVVTKPGSHPELTIVLPYYAVDPDLTEPPTLFTPELQNGQKFSFDLDFYVYGCDGDYPFYDDPDSNVYLQVGSGSRLNYDVVINSAVQYCHIASNMLPPGKSNIKIVAYDSNNNRCELNKEVEYIPSVSSAVDPPVPDGSDPIINAYTFSDSREFLSSSRSPRGGQADENGSTVAVELMMHIEDATNGFSAYRLDESTGHYILVGHMAEETVISEGTTMYYLVDISPDLIPGTTQIYRVNYFNNNGNSENFWLGGVDILPETTFILTSPADFSIVNTTRPTFTWECALEDTQGEFYLSVTDSYGSPIWAGSLGGYQSFELPVPLAIGKEYIWNVTGCLYRSHSLGKSYWYQNKYHDSTNGAFTFTVLPEKTS